MAVSVTLLLYLSPRAATPKHHRQGWSGAYATGICFPQFWRVTDCSQKSRSGRWLCAAESSLWVTTIFLLCPHIAFPPCVRLERDLESLPSLIRTQSHPGDWPSWPHLTPITSQRFHLEIPPWGWRLRHLSLLSRTAFLDISPVEEKSSLDISGTLSGK